MLKFMLFLMFALLCSCTTPKSFNETSAANQGTDSQTLSEGAPFWENNSTVIWDKIKHSSTNKLQNALNQTNNPTLTGWLKLALISKKYSLDSQTLSQQLAQWRKEYPAHPGNKLFPDDAALASLQGDLPDGHLHVGNT